MNKTTLVIMAAGMGSRYGGLKQVDPVGPNGEIIMDYSVYDAVRAGFNNAIIIIKRENETIFREKAGRRIEKQIDVDYSFQEIHDIPEGCNIPEKRIKPWGTAHAVMSCRNLVKNPFAVINADDFYGRTAFIRLHQHLSGAAENGAFYDFSMVGFILENTLTDHGHVSRGICSVDVDGFLQNIEEKTKIEKAGNEAVYSEDGVNWERIPRGTIVSMNAWGFTPVIFEEIEGRFPRFLHENRERIIEAEFYLPSLVHELINEGKAKVKVLKTDNRWHGVTYPEDKAEVKKALAAMTENGTYPDNLNLN